MYRTLLYEYTANAVEKQREIASVTIMMATNMVESILNFSHKIAQTIFAIAYIESENPI